MLCKKIEELLKSDYLDGRLSGSEEKDVNEHLLHCPQCSKLKEALESQRAIFRNTRREEVPEQVWQNIRNTIITERLNEHDIVHSRVFNRLRDLLWQPRPVFALASAFAAIILVVVFTESHIQKKQVLSNGVGIIAGYRINSESENTLPNLGTNIEEYFF